MQLGVRRQFRLFDLLEFLGDHQAKLGVFIADVEIGLRGLDHPSRDQHAFDKAVGIAFEIVTVLEGAGLALVAIDREHSRRGLRAHKRPFASGREPGAAEAAQAGIADDLDEFVARALAREAIAQQRVAAGFLVRSKIRFRRPGVGMLVRLDVGEHRVGRRLERLQVTDSADRRTIASAHAGRAHDAHILAELTGQFLEQFFRTGHRARKRVAHAHGNRRRRRTVLYDIEVRIEGRDLVDFGKRHFHFGSKRRQVRGGETAVVILDQMQMLDQQIAAARPICQQGAHFIECGRIYLPTLGRARGFAATPGSFAA